jgi:hypothetical protein
MRGVADGYDEPPVALSSEVDRVPGDANVPPGADHEPVPDRDQPVAVHVRRRRRELLHQLPVEGERGDDAAHRLAVQDEGHRPLQRDPRVRARDAVAVKVEDQSVRPPGEALDRRAVVREEGALQDGRAGEVVRVRGGVLGQCLELVLGGLHLRREGSVRAVALVPERVRVEDADRRDDRDPGCDKEAGEQLQAGAPRQVGSGCLSPRRGLWLGRRNC